ncbi:MAG: class I SAM-dependent methyltransferase [Gammaproteobacteria bacterium]|nr:class I SAM-dependent methyltransferase [Gammaproteobacteria bacterium]
MNIEELKEKKKEVEEKYGPWTAHDILLPGGIRTMDYLSGDLEGTKDRLRKPLSDEEKDYALHLQAASFWEEYSPSSSHLKRIVQIVSDVCDEPWENLRVLDLACMEGGFSVEFALRGADVLGIEGREANIAKARFAKQALSLQNVDFVQDDVRNVNAEKYGRFDVVLCIGILYHLDSDSVFLLLENVAEMCDRILVIDTHVSLRPSSHVTHKDRVYWGVHHREHRPEATDEEKRRNLWQSIDNVESFQPTRFSLFNFLQHSGFSSVLECSIPPVFWAMGNRSTFVAINGTAISQVYATREPLVQEDYSEVDSGRKDSELHVLKSELDSITKHPSVKLVLLFSRALQKLRSFVTPRT